MAKVGSPAALLYEYCSKKKIPLPTPKYILHLNGKFCCTITLKKLVGRGMATTKRAAKQLAAANLMKRIAGNKDDAPTPSSSSATLAFNAASAASAIPPCAKNVSNTDAVNELRAFCELHNYPFPIFDLVQTTGTPENPEYIVLCSVAPIICYGTSNSKSNARQVVAHETLQKLKLNTHLMPDKSHLIGYPDHLKMQAVRIINDDTYNSAKSKAMDILKVLDIKPKIRWLESSAPEPIYFIDLKIKKIDSVFCGDEATVYNSIIQYFEEEFCNNGASCND